MLAISIVQFALYLAAFVLGLKFFLLKKTPLYFRLLFYGVACFLLEEIYYAVDFACTGVWGETFSFAAFGASAGYAFMFSANYGQFDSFVDDGSAGCERARKIAYLAPILLVVLYAFMGVECIRLTGRVAFVVLTILCKLPAFAAGYYNLKHLLLPDSMHFVVDSLRPCNLMCLCLILFDSVSDILDVLGYKLAYGICETIIAVILVLVMIFAERGHKAWKI